MSSSSAVPQTSVAKLDRWKVPKLIPSIVLQARNLNFLNTHSGFVTNICVFLKRQIFQEVDAICSSSTAPFTSVANIDK